jgi:hypothetical protein
VGLQPTDDALLAKVEAYLAEGYRRIKVKVKPGRDVTMLAAVRDAFPEAQLTWIEILDESGQVMRRHEKASRKGTFTLESGDRLFNPSRETRC